MDSFTQEDLNDLSESQNKTNGCECEKDLWGGCLGVEGR